MIGDNFHNHGIEGDMNLEKLFTGALYRAKSMRTSSVSDVKFALRCTGKSTSEHIGYSIFARSRWAKHYVVRDVNVGIHTSKVTGKNTQIFKATTSPRY